MRATFLLGVAVVVALAAATAESTSSLPKCDRVLWLSEHQVNVILALVDAGVRRGELVLDPLAAIGYASVTELQKIMTTAYKHTDPPATALRLSPFMFAVLEDVLDSNLDGIRLIGKVYADDYRDLVDHVRRSPKANEC